MRVGRHRESVGDPIIGERGGRRVDRDSTEKRQIAIGGDDASAGDGGAVDGERHGYGQRIRRARDYSGGPWGS